MTRILAQSGLRFHPQGLGFSIIAKHKSVQLSTVESYVAEAILAGYAYDWYRCGVSEPELAAVAAFAATAVCSDQTGVQAAANHRKGPPLQKQQQEQQDEGVHNQQPHQEHQHQQRQPSFPLPLAAHSSQAAHVFRSAQVVPLPAASSGAEAHAAPMPPSGVFADDSDDDLSLSQLEQLQRNSPLRPATLDTATARAHADAGSPAVRPAGTGQPSQTGVLLSVDSDSELVYTTPRPAAAAVPETHRAAGMHDVRQLGDSLHVLAAAVSALSAVTLAAVSRVVDRQTKKHDCSLCSGCCIGSGSGAHGCSARDWCISNIEDNSLLGCVMLPDLAAMLAACGIGIRAIKEGLPVEIGFGRIRLALAHLSRLLPLRSVMYAGVQQ